MIKVLINNVEQQAEQGFTVTQAADVYKSKNSVYSTRGELPRFLRWG